MSYPNTQTLSSEEKDLVWQYRFYLSANKKALAKFVKCVDWNTKTEANQALDLVRLDINLHYYFNSNKDIRLSIYLFYRMFNC